MYGSGRKFLKNTLVFFSVKSESSSSGNSCVDKVSSESELGDFPGVPVAKTPHYQCRGPRLDPWSRN